MFLQWALAIAPKAAARQGACLTLGSEAMQVYPGEDVLGSFHGHFWDKNPEGMVILWCVWAGGQAGGRQGKMLPWALHSPPHSGIGARCAKVQQGQRNDPHWAPGVQQEWLSACARSFKAEQSPTEHEIGMKGGAWAAGQLSMPWHRREKAAPSSFGTWEWLRAAVEDVVAARVGAGSVSRPGTGQLQLELLLN